MLSANSKSVTREAWGPGVVGSVSALSVVLRRREPDTAIQSHLLSERSSQLFVHHGGQLKRKLPPGWGGRDGGRASSVSISQWHLNSCPVTMATQAARGGDQQAIGYNLSRRLEKKEAEVARGGAGE